MHDPAAALHKIGFSIAPDRRAKQVGAELLGQIRTDNMLWLERYLHVAFAGCRVHGEWFRLPHDAVALLLCVAVVDTEADLPEPIRSLYTSAIAEGLVRHKTTQNRHRPNTGVSIRIDPELRAKIPEFQAQFKRLHAVKLDLTAVVEMALRRLFLDNGLLSNDEPAPDPTP